MEKLKLFAELISGALFKGPKMLGWADRFLNAWNNHDVDAIVQLIGKGSYRDPLSKQRVNGEALGLHAKMLLTAFPDLRFELASKLAAGTDVVSAQYCLHGTNTGELPGDLGFERITATGKCIELPGSLSVEFDKSGLVHVNNFFDQVAFAESIGFQPFLVPQRMGDFDFGAYYRLNRGNRAPPNAIGITWLLAEDPSQFIEAATVTREVLEDLSENPGFVTGIIGAKMPDDDGVSAGFTLSAWESLEDMDRILANPKHQEVVQKFMKQGLATGTHSRVYELVREKPVMIACKNCGKKNNAYKKTHACSACGSELPPAPRYW
ncbi:MAG: ester cyclase [Salinisphaeraceae bacterium]|nr:ester cyclase [Salinisphaeraceae bacterium]